MNFTIIDICKNCKKCNDFRRYILGCSFKPITHIWIIRNKYHNYDNDKEFGESLIRDISKTNYKVYYLK
jgi:hypothetical protein